MKESSTKLEQKLWSRGLVENAPIVLYFDESHVLHDPIERDEPTQYKALCLALNALSHTKIFSLFLSTRFEFVDPTEDSAPPPRIIQDYGVHAPYTHLPFDDSPGLPVKAGKYTLEYSSRMFFLCRFGRPLYVFLVFSLIKHDFC